MYVAIENNCIDDALDLIIQRFDNLYCDNKFEECDSLFDNVDLQRLDTNALVGILITSNLAKNE